MQSGNIMQITQAVVEIGAALTILGPAWDTRLVLHEGEVAYWYLRSRARAPYIILVRQAPGLLSAYLNYDGRPSHDIDNFGRHIVSGSPADILGRLDGRLSGAQWEYNRLRATVEQCRGVSQ